MAVAAFVCALVSIFVSVLWPIALLLWLLSLVLGHTAISNCRSDPTLRGKGLAVAAVSISYVILALSLVLGALIALRNS
jgi:energy-converting hydrogenase Eha subunit E